MKFDEYFNPYNPIHVGAFKHQQKTGWWPLWFGVVGDQQIDEADRHQWGMLAMAKCSEAWLEYVDYKHKCKTEFIPGTRCCPNQL